MIDLTRLDADKLCDKLRDAAIADYNDNWALLAELEKHADFRVGNYHLLYSIEADLVLLVVSSEIWLVGGSFVEQLETSPYSISALIAECKLSLKVRMPRFPSYTAQMIPSQSCYRISEDGKINGFLRCRADERRALTWQQIPERLQTALRERQTAPIAVVCHAVRNGQDV